jgi:hypothetical protein
MFSWKYHDIARFHESELSYFKEGLPIYAKLLIARACPSLRLLAHTITFQEQRWID